MRPLFLLIPALLFTACGKTSTERVEAVSDCRMESPLEIGTNAPGDATRNGMALTDVVFRADPSSESVKHERGSEPFEIRLFNVEIAGQVRSEVLGFSLEPAKLVGFFPTYKDALVKEPMEDPQGFHFYYPGRRSISGRIRQTGETYQYSTRMAEGVIHVAATDKTILTSLRVTVENKKLTAMEFNIPSTKTSEWRDGESYLPILEAWRGLSERLCVKSARLKP